MTAALFYNATINEPQLLLSLVFGPTCNATPVATHNATPVATCNATYNATPVSSACAAP